MKFLLRASTLLALSSCGFYSPQSTESAGRLPDGTIAELESFRSLADAYLAWHYATHPTWATSDGIHDHDNQLDRCARTDVEGEIDALRRYQQRLLAIDPLRLDLDDACDLEVLKLQVAASLLDLLTIRGWEKNPNHYRGIISHGLYTLATLSFDTPERRMALAAERLQQVPGVLAAAKHNLSHPPKIYTEIAIDEFGGTHSFLKTTLPAAFAAVKDDTVRARFVEMQKAALDAVEKFQDWMKKELLPQSDGTFAIGAQAYHDKVAFEEGLDVPLEDLLRRGYELLKVTQAEMNALAGKRPLRPLLKESSKEHPSAATLIADTQAMLQGLKDWSSGIVTIPPDAMCRVQETPEFRRSLSFASMETPGPFEKVAREAYYSVTLPDPSWPPEKQEQHLSFFNKYSLLLVSAHEAFPGHYTQFLAVQNCPSRIRKAFGCSSFSEGWAHYTEQLYVEQHPDAPLPLKLQQLQLALLRICRYIVGIEMHARGMTLEKAVEFFETEGYMERAGAEREARRGTSDPTYLVYTLGKHEILKLREEYLARPNATLKGFHDDLIRHGYPPIPIARKLLFGSR